MEKHKVLRKQPNSADCIVCGLDNDLSLKTRFYELENEEVVALFTPKNEHQSYPERLHGGVATAILDETIGRAIMIGDSNDVFGVTIELNTKFKKPVPLDVELKARGRLTSRRGRIFEGSGELILPNGDVAVSCTGKYLRMPIADISKEQLEGDSWKVVDEEDPEYIEI